MLAPLEDDDVCPNCGKWSTLREDTGWCAACSGGEACSRCGSIFSRDQESRIYCPSCRAAMWLERNADIIEEHMSHGMSFVEARSQVALDNRPRCRNCSAVLNHGHAGRGFFCQKKECRQAYHRYKWKRRKGIQIEQALREAVYGSSIETSN